MAAMTSWRRTASAKSGTVRFPFSVPTHSRRLRGPVCAGPTFSGVRNRRLWTCDEHGVIYSAPDDATVYGDVTCPECGERLLRYPPPDRVFWLCSADPAHQGWDGVAPEDRRCPECGDDALAWRLSPVH